MLVSLTQETRYHQISLRPKLCTKFKRQYVSITKIINDAVCRIMVNLLVRRKRRRMRKQKGPTHYHKANASGIIENRFKYACVHDTAFVCVFIYRTCGRSYLSSRLFFAFWHTCEPGLIYSFIRWQICGFNNYLMLKRIAIALELFTNMENKLYVDLNCYFRL